MTGQHVDAGLGVIHKAHNWEYADATAREAASGFAADDLKKLALQLSNNSLWVLTAITPTWVQVGGDGGEGAGKVLQVVQSQDSAVDTTATQMLDDNAIPQNTEGKEFLTQAITPNDSANILYIKVVLNVSPSIACFTVMALFQDSVADALAANLVVSKSAVENWQIVLMYKMVAGTTDPITFKIRAGMDRAGTLTVNGVVGIRKLGGVLFSSLEISEVEA